eukprot:SAG31_NODE_2667_length_5273_cov_2.316776_4_plen_86_part_00
MVSRFCNSGQRTGWQQATITGELRQRARRLAATALSERQPPGGRLGEADDGFALAWNGAASIFLSGVAAIFRGAPCTQQLYHCHG